MKIFAFNIKSITITKIGKINFFKIVLHNFKEIIYIDPRLTSSISLKRKRKYCVILDTRNVVII